MLRGMLGTLRRRGKREMEKGEKYKELIFSPFSIFHPEEGHRDDELVCRSPD